MANLVQDDSGRPVIGVVSTSTGKAVSAHGFPLGSINAQAVAIVDGSGAQITSFGGGTQYTNGAATVANPVGTMPVYDNGGTISKVSTTLGLPIQVIGTPAVTATLQTQTDTIMIGGVNIKEINAVPPLMGNGITGTGSLRITVASDNSAVALWGHGATAATVPANATYAGRRGSTALPTAVTDGQQVGSMGDKFGRTVALIGAMRDLTLPMTQLTLANTTETTLIAAVAATFLDIVSVTIINTSATATQVDFRDSTGGTIRWSAYVPPTDMRGIVLPVPIPQNAVNNNWTAKLVTAVSSIIISGLYITNK